MKKDPLISIIVPVYNCEAFLQRCLDSLLGQTLSDIEIITLDDASTDNSLTVLKKCARKDKRLKIISDGKNLGPGKRRNQGISIAQGQYIMMVDGDDWLEKDSCSKLMEKMSQATYDAISFNAIIENKDRKSIANYYCIKEEFCGTWQHIEPYIFRTAFHSWHWLYRRSFLQKNNITYSDCPIFEDVPFVLQVLLKAEKILFYPENLYHYTQNEQSLVHKQSSKFMCIFEVIKSIDDILLQNKVEDILASQFRKWQERHLNFCSVKIETETRPCFLQKIKELKTKISKRKLFLFRKISFLGLPLLNLRQPNTERIYCSVLGIKMISLKMRHNYVKTYFFGIPILKITKIE